MFERDWNGDRSKVVDKVHVGCEWVANGEGFATQKLDGTCCMIRDGKLYKRRELKDGETAPESFELVGRDEETGKSIGWVPVGEGPEDKWHRVAFKSDLSDGTYELIGPKVQGNPEGVPEHMLISHAFIRPYADTPRTFSELREWLASRNIEGIVWHHPDGRMAKIKLRDFGLKRKANTSDTVPTLRTSN